MKSVFFDDLACWYYAKPLNKNPKLECLHDQNSQSMSFAFLYHQTSLGLYNLSGKFRVYADFFMEKHKKESIKGISPSNEKWSRILIPFLFQNRKIRFFATVLGTDSATSCRCFHKLFQNRSNNLFPGWRQNVLQPNYCIFFRNSFWFRTFEL